MKNKLFLLAGLVSCGLEANAQMGNFTDPIRLGSGINTEAEETMPVFSKDSSILYFSRTFDATNTGGLADEDIWFSTKENGEYAKSDKVKGLNNKFNNAVLGISKDGTAIYLFDSYEGKKDLVKGLAISKQKGNGWETPVHVDVPTLDINGNFYGFHVDETEKVMIITYAGPGAIGEEDLYVSTKNGDSWSAPVHMGNVINSTGFEISPFLSKNLDTLFFSSNGFGGQGDADIFYSVKGSSWTDWSTPVNLGSKVNSPKFDGYFTYSASQIYWASNKESERSDIYTASIIPPPPPPPLVASVTVIDVSEFKAEDGKIDLKLEGGTGPYTVIWSNNAKTEDIQGLKAGSYTAIITDAKGQTTEISVEMKEGKVKDLGPLLVGIKPIYFDVAKYNIRKDAAKELDKIVKIMNTHPTIEIELGSHTDCQASAEYNLILSDKRAKASAAYIKAKITNPERINGRGYGESRLISNCPCEGDVKSSCSDKEHQLNRRTEFVLRKEGDPKMEDIMSPSQTFEASKTTSGTNGTSTSGTKSTLPAGSKFRTDIPVTDEQRANIANGFYIVQEGETLYRVFVNTKVATAELRRINNLTSNSIKPGTKLLLK
jgi:OOP family OmpA-OmpF porin